MGTVEGGLIVVCLLLVVAHVLNARYTHVASRVSVDWLLKGGLRYAFVGGALLVGLRMPVLLVLWDTRRSRATTCASSWPSPAPFPWGATGCRSTR